MVKRIFKVSLNSLFVLLFVFFLLSIFLLVQGRMNPDQVPSLFGYQPLTVLSNSMQPTFSAGDMVISKEQNAENISVGDVITYYDEQGNIITHRVIEQQIENGQLSFQTQGDNNNVADSYTVGSDQLIGTVNMTVPYAGYIFEFLRSPLGMVLFIIVPLFSYIGILIYERLGRNEEDKDEAKEQLV